MSLSNMEGFDVIYKWTLPPPAGHGILCVYDGTVCVCVCVCGVYGGTVCVCVWTGGTTFKRNASLKECLTLRGTVCVCCVLEVQH